MENICEWKGCKKKGAYKAPTERDNSKKFMWLCKNHIITFNSEWDYFDGMTQNEIAIFLRSDATWHRPTQKFGSMNNFFNILWNNALDDKFKLFSENGNSNFHTNVKLSEKDKIAFKTMNLKLSDDWNTVQKKFKGLVKKYHPDKNQGNKVYENQLKKVTLAYSHLRSIFKEKKV